MIKIENFYKLFGKNEVLKGIIIMIEKGEVVVIIGFFGLGKLMFLCCMNMLEVLMDGYIWIGMEEVMNLKMNVMYVCENVGMVF